jgi:predicted 2-oxoglutarate/Fe(II)-dependent dioxygenase YbiX
MLGITILPDLVTEVECEDLISRLDAKTNGSDMYHFDGIQRNYSIKKLECKNDRFINYVLDILKIDKTKLHSSQLLYYPTNSYNGLHADNCILDNNGNFVKLIKPWTHTGILYLNNDYSGGQLTFVDQNVTMKCSAGTFIMSPSNHEYKHKVSRIVSGERYSLVFRFIFDN